MKSLKESLFDDDLVTRKTVPEKLAYVLRKFFGPNVALCMDYQGNYTWYEVNPSTWIIKDSKNLNKRILGYCKKIDGLDIVENTIKGLGYTRGYRIGDDEYWMYLDFSCKYFKKLIVSEKFYSCGLLPQDQTGVTRRGWESWQNQRL